MTVETASCFRARALFPLFLWPALLEESDLSRWVGVLRADLLMLLFLKT